MRLSTYLLFDGNCRQAMEYYHTLLGGELTMTTVGDSPVKGFFPPDKHGRIVNARLRSEWADLSASDWLHPTQTPMKGNLMCLYIHEGNIEETKALFARIAEGAAVTDPLREQPFGVYGALNDRFGVRWMFHASR